MQSVLAQTYAQLEVILVDDGSTDGSFNFSKQYLSNHVHVIKQKNAGASVARNTGLAAAQGDFIQFLDAGDILSNEKIEAQVYALKAQPGKVAVCNYKQFTAEEEIYDSIYPDQSSFIYTSNDPQDFLINLWGGKGAMNFIQTNCWLVPKELIEKAGPWREYRCPDDDGEFFTRVLLKSEGIVYVPGVYNYYHIEPDCKNQLSKSINKKYLQNTLLTIDLKYHYLLQKSENPYIRYAIALQYFYYAVYVYPRQKLLSNIAYRRFKQFNVQIDPPVLGGKLIEGIKHLFGWRSARIFRYYFRER